MIARLVDGSTTIDLINNTDGFVIAHDGWIQGRPAQDEEGNWSNAFENITLRINFSDHDDLASKLQLLDGVLYQANRNRRANLVPDNRVWIQAQMDDESNLRQSLVLNGVVEPRRGFYGPPIAPGTWLLEHLLTIERHPFWERSTGLTISRSGLSAAGGRWNYGPSGIYPMTSDGVTIPGDASARIAATRINGISGGGGPLTEFWIGFKTDEPTEASENDDRTGFAPNWRLDNGTLAADTSTYGDSTAIFGAGITCSMSPTTIATRITQTLNTGLSGTGNPYPRSQRGTNLVLLRAKAGGSRTYHVRMQVGNASGDIFRVYPRVLVNKTDWYLHPLGTIDVPMMTRYGDWTKTGIMENVSIKIDAEVATTGTGNLLIDSLLMMPIEDGMLYAKGGLVRYVTGTSYLEIVVDDGDRAGSFSFDDSTDAYDSPEFSIINNWALPNEPGMVVFVAQRAAEHDKDDEVELKFTYYPRWLTLRGDE